MSLTASDISNLQRLIQQRGLTKEQAQHQFGLDEGTMGYLTNSGVSFAVGGGNNNVLVNSSFQPHTTPMATTPGYGGLSRADIRGMGADPSKAFGTPEAKFLTGGGNTGAPIGFQVGHAMEQWRTDGDYSGYGPGLGRVLADRAVARQQGLMDANLEARDARVTGGQDHLTHNPELLAARGMGGDNQPLVGGVGADQTSAIPGGGSAFVPPDSIHSMGAPERKPKNLPTFTPVAPPHAQPGLRLPGNLAAQGQGGDNQIAHVTPGETVVPREIMAANPDLKTAVDSAFAAAGSDPRKYKVGVNPVINPRTGVQQFAADASIQDWYRNVAGRDATQPELDYWQGQAGSLGGQQAFNNFVSGLQANGEKVKTTDYTAANTAYNGVQSADGKNYVDDWARNVFGRAATPEEIAQFGSAQTPQQATEQYNNFVNAGKTAGGNPKLMSIADASQIAAVGNDTLSGGGGNGQGGDAFTGVITAGAAPAPNYVAPPAGQGLYDAMQVPDAVQASKISLAPAAQAVGSAPVVAGQGTAGTYTATTAGAAPAVTAGAGTAATAQNTNASVVNSTATGYDAAQGNAAQWDVTDDQTVQGQVRKIVDENSPLQQQAKADSLKAANAHGLANSSMAVTAGQDALYRAALPIAQQDAQTHAQSGQFNAGNRQQMELANVDAKNTASRFYAAATNDSSKENAQLGTQTNLSNAAEANKTSMFNAQSSNDMTTKNLDRALQAGVVNQEQANKMAALAAENINRAAEFNITTNAQMQQFNIDAALKAGIVNKQQADALSQFNAQQANAMTVAQGELDAKISTFNASQSNDLIKLGMDGQTKVALGNIEASYKTLMQASSSAASVYSQAMNNITSILTNKDMSPDAKRIAVGNLVGALNGSLGVIGGIANLDLPELVFGNDTLAGGNDTLAGGNNGDNNNAGGGSNGDGGAIGGNGAFDWGGIIHANGAA
jgi:hypothetical protein